MHGTCERSEMLTQAHLDHGQALAILALQRAALYDGRGDLVEYRKACINEIGLALQVRSLSTGKPLDPGPNAQELIYELPPVSSAERNGGLENPPATRIRGKCPECGGHLICNSYYTGPRGWLFVYECWPGLVSRSCNYRKVI